MPVCYIDVVTSADPMQSMPSECLSGRHTDHPYWRIVSGSFGITGVPWPMCCSDFRGVGVVLPVVSFISMYVIYVSLLCIVFVLPLRGSFFSCIFFSAVLYLLSASDVFYFLH